MSRQSEVRESRDPLARLLERSRTIAVVGCSPDPTRPSHRVAAYLHRAGYDVIPINPNVDDVEGLKAYERLGDVPGPVDLVVVFRRPEEAEGHVDEAIAKGVVGIWLQEGVTTPDGAEQAARAGIEYVEDRCVMVEHRRRYMA